MSAMQKLVLEQDAKRHVPMVSTHFYQVDPKEGKHRAAACHSVMLLLLIVYDGAFNVSDICSTTRTDFIPPEEVCS